MTFEEAKKILEKEGFELEKRPGITVDSIGESPEWEKIVVNEAMKVVAKNSYVTLMDILIYKKRKERLQKEYEENTKAPGSGEEQPEEKKRIIYPSTSPKADFYYKHVLNEGNPALEEAASQFNDALLDEQAKKIAELTKEKANLEDQITVLNACKKHNDKIDRKQIKCLGKEIAKLNGIIHDKDAVLADVAEELRLSKIREKNLTELCQKYIKANEELKKELDVAKKQNTAVMVDMTAKCLRAARESINDVFESYAAKYAKSSLDDLKEKAYELFNAKAHNLGLVGSKDGNGIFDQMVGADIAEEGGDLSGVIVLCGKDFIDAIKKMK